MSANNKGNSGDYAEPQAVHLPTAAETAAQLLGGHKPHASPAVRRFARELGADLAAIHGSGPQQRITFDDIKRHVRAIVTTAYAQQRRP